MTPEQEELFFLRMEKAIAQGVKDGLREHIENEHAALVVRVDKLDRQMDKVNVKVWWLTGAGAGAGAAIAAAWKLLSGGKP